jgi:type II secretory pathway predicted ATPase ExeA
MAWGILSRVLKKPPEEAIPTPSMPELRAQLASEPRPPPAPGAAPDAAVPARIDDKPDDLPAFARRAAVEGGGPSQPAFAHSPFTPTRPILNERGLMGRRKQLERAIRAVQIERAHLTIFGERGNGKTSFSNVLASLAEDAGYGVVRHTCTTAPTFGELFGAVVAQIPARFLRPVMAEEEAQSFGRRQIWTVATAVAKLQEIRAGHVLVMIDEFDRLSDAEAKRDMTELLKTTSDLSVRVSFVLIGVAESIDELLDMHPSLMRTIVAIPLPLLPDTDIGALLDKGCNDLRLAITQPARDALLMLAQGSPYIGQLLSLHASDHAVRRGAGKLAAEDVIAAIALVVDETRHSFEPMLAGLPRADARWPNLLFAGASARCNGFGWFTAASAKESANRLGMDLPSDLSFGLSVLASPDGGQILKKRAMPAADEFCFAHVNLRNYVLLREAVQRGVIKATPDETAANTPPSTTPEAEEAAATVFAPAPAGSNTSPAVSEPADTPAGTTPAPAENQAVEEVAA